MLLFHKHFTLLFLNFLGTLLDLRLVSFTHSHLFSKYTAGVKPTHPYGYWADLNNQRQFLDSIAKDFGVNEVRISIELFERKF